MHSPFVVPATRALIFQQRAPSLESCSIVVACLGCDDEGCLVVHYADKLYKSMIASDMRLVPTVGGEGDTQGTIQAFQAFSNQL